MDWATELKHIGISTNCNECALKRCAYGAMWCEKFQPVEPNKLLSDVVWKLQNTTDKSKSTRLTRHITTDTRSGITYDNKETLDNYYVSMINDTLSLIRAGKTAYIFHLYQVKDLIKFEDIMLRYNTEADCFEVSV